MNLEQIDLYPTFQTPILNEFNTYKSDADPNTIFYLTEYKGVIIRVRKDYDGTFKFSPFFQAYEEYSKYNENKMNIISTMEQPRKFKKPSINKINKWLEYISSQHNAFFKAIGKLRQDTQLAINDFIRLSKTAKVGYGIFMVGDEKILEMESQSIKIRRHINNHTGYFYDKITFIGNTQDAINIFENINNKDNDQRNKPN